MVRGRAVVLDRPQEALQLEAGQGEDGGAGRQAGVQDDVEPDGVEERRHRDHHVVLAEPDRGQGLADVGDQVGVGQLHALGQAGGAAGVGEGRDVPVGVDGHPGRRLPVGDQLPERGGALRLPEDQHLLDAGLVGGGQRALQERRHGDQQPRLRVGELAGQFLGGEQRVGAGNGPAGGHRPVRRQGVLGQVGAVEGERVAGGEAAGGQAGRNPLDPGGELPVGDGPAAGGVDQGRLVAEAAGVPQGQLRDGGAADLHVG
jgi:hypothetical protein